MDRKLASALIGLVTTGCHPGSERSPRHRPSDDTGTPTKNRSRRPRTPAHNGNLQVTPCTFPTVNHAVAARRIVEEGPAAPIFADVDRDLRATGTTLRVELAEETVAALYDGLVDPAAHTDVTVWVPGSLGTAAAAAPDSYFAAFAADEGSYDAYEVVDEAATLAFVFDRCHPETDDLGTRYDHLTVAFPTPGAFHDAAGQPTERVTRSL